MGKSKAQKQQVADYLLSIHFGVCHQADSIERIRVKDKTIWEGRRTANDTLSINLPDLYGGSLKEGGARGLVEILMGGITQLLPSRLASKLGGTPSTVPGFRGITSLFFTGGGPQATEGFYWTSNQGYIPAVDVTVRRSPKGFYPEKARIPRAELPTVDITSGVLIADWVHANYSTPSNYDPSTPGNPLYAQTGDVCDVRFNNWTGNTVTLPARTFRFEGFDPRWKLNLNFQSPDTGVANTVSNNVHRVEFLLDDGSVGLALGITQTTYTQPVSGTVVPALSPYYEAPGVGVVNLGVATPSTPYVNSWSTNLTFGAASVTATQGIAAGFTADCKVEKFAAIRVYSSIDASWDASYPSKQMGVVVQVTGLSSYDLDSPDANPVHIVYECLTNNDWGLGLPAEIIDTVSFTAAANTCYAERLGLSMIWSQQTTIEDFINEVLGHIDGVCGVDPETGKIYISLVRGGYSLDGLFDINEDNAVITQFQRKSLSDTTNEVVVTYTNPDNEQEQTVTVHDLGNYALQGILISSSSNYYGVRKGSLALRLAMRDLARGSAPVASVAATVNRKGWKLKPGDVATVTSVEYGLNKLPCRVVEVEYGRPGDSKIKVSLVEDVFTTPEGAYVEAPGTLWQDTPSAQTPLDRVYGASVPYYFVAAEVGTAEAQATLEDVVYGLVLTMSRSGADGAELLVPVANALGTVSYESVTTLDTTTYTTLGSALTVQAASTVTLGALQGNTSLKPGMFLWIGEGDPKNSELCLVTATDPAITVKRGVLDTVPKAWAAGSPVWFITPGIDAVDPEDRAPGQTVTYRLLPSYGGAPANEKMTSAASVTYDDRQHRPYRPANVKINTLLWPASVTAAPAVTDITFTWARRNRFTEEPIVLDWTTGDTTPEAGTTYDVLLTRVDTGATIASVTGVTGTSAALTCLYTGVVKVTITAKRDGLSCYQPFVHQFSYISAAVEALTTESGENLLTEDGELIILES